MSDSVQVFVSYHLLPKPLKISDRVGPNKKVSRGQIPVECLILTFRIGYGSQDRNFPDYVFQKLILFYLPNWMNRLLWELDLGSSEESYNFPEMG